MIETRSRRHVMMRAVATLGLTLLTGQPNVGIAQTIPVLGYLTHANVDPARLADFRSGLAEFGYVEGRNIAIKVRSARSSAEYDALAAELVASRIHIIIAVNSAATSAARRASSSIPIVMTAVNDPVEWGFVESMERPGTNVTGTTLNAPHLVGERLRILKQLAPTMNRVSMFIVARNPANPRLFALLTSEAQSIGIGTQALEVQQPADIGPAFDKARGWGSMALLHANDPFINAQRIAIAARAARDRLPMIYADREYVAAGGLMSLGPGHRQGDVGAARYVEAILHGARPAELALSVPTQFTFVVGRSALARLGINLPDDLKAKVTEWID